MDKQEKILVTGAAGFIGRSLCRALNQAGYFVRACVRNHEQSNMLRSQIDDLSLLDCYICSSLETFSDWSLLLEDIDYVIHLAARVHVMQEDEKDPLTAFRTINVDATKRLVEAVVKKGIKRFLYMSTIKVYGEKSTIPLTELTPVKPVDPYAITKWEAEQCIQEIAKKSDLDFVIIRPPLVYGKQARANFQQLIQWIQKGYPLPLKDINNQRSIIYIDNLIHGIIYMLTHVAAKQQVYLIDDGCPVSTSVMIEAVANALGKSSRLFFLPKSLIHLLGWLTGQTSKIDRLTTSLFFDTKKIRQELNWTPPFTLMRALKKEFEKETK